MVPRHTEFRTAPEVTEITIQDVYAALVDDAARNEMIAADLLRAVQAGRSPLLLTGRTEHLQYFAAKLDSTVKHVFVLKGGMGKKQRRATAEALASVPGDEPPVILATGSYIGEGFDDARLDTLFLDKEKEIGTQVSAAFEKSTTLLHDSTTQAYLDRLAQTITRNSDSQLPITIRVIDSDSSYVIRAVTNMTPLTCPSGVNSRVPNGGENATMHAGSFSCGFFAERAW